MKSRIDTGCRRKMDEKDSRLSNLNLCATDQPVLQIMRLYMQSASHPQSMAWMIALSGSEDTFGPVYGPQISCRTLDALQRVRLSRRSPFSFNSPACPTCCQIITEHERRFMTALRYVRANLHGQAQMELIMLCEGNDVDKAANALVRLATTLADYELSETRPTVFTNGIVGQINQ